MKGLNLIAIILLPLVVSAKIGDFNELIKDTQASQQQLHSELRNGLDMSRVAVQNAVQPQVVVDSESYQVNSPTNTEILKFDKEKRSYRPSQKKQDERLAEELKEESLSF